MDHVILDTSAILCLIQGTPGASQLEPLVGKIQTSSLVILEVMNSLITMNLDDFESKKLIDSLITHIQPFDYKTAADVILLKRTNPDLNLSYADGTCCNMAHYMQLPLYTMNEQWQSLKYYGDIDIKVVEMR